MLEIERIMVKQLICVCLCFFFLSWNTPIENRDEHAIYISVIKIQHEQNQPQATIFMRVFTDDLKSALRNKFGYESITDKLSFCTDYENYINRYFKKQFTCLINNSSVEYQLSNCEKTEDVYQLEFVMECPEKWDSAKITAPFFMELFPNQSNVVHLENGDTKRFGRATKGNELLRIRF